MARPIILGVVGDSAAGKTTLTRGLVRVLGEENVTHVCVDDYHCYDRRQRAERNITPLHPDCNYMDIMAQHLCAHARRRSVPEAGLPPRRRHLRPARAGSSRRSSAWSTGCSATTPRICAASTTCASTSPRPRSSAASGRCSATARAAATRPTRCSPSSIGARPTRRRSSGRSSTTPTSSSRSCPVATTRSTSTPSCCCARRCGTPT